MTHKPGDSPLIHRAPPQSSPYSKSFGCWFYHWLCPIHPCPCSAWTETSSLAGRTEFLFLLLLAQHLLRVAYQDPSSGCTSKTLAVPPEASIATLNKLCATKFRVTHPDTFGLFLYKGQDYQRLPPGALAHRLPTAGYLVYRRAEQPETPGASPGAATGEGSGGPEAGDREEDKEGRGTGETKAKTSPRDGRGESETVAEGAEDQARGDPTQPRGPETEESQAAEE